MVKFPNISPNLLLGVGGIIAAVFFVSQIRKAGADVVDALPTLDEGARQSISDIASALGTTAQNFEGLQNQFTQFQSDASANVQSISDFFSNLFSPSISELDFTGIPTAQEIADNTALSDTLVDPNADPNRFVPTGDPFTGREEDRPVEPDFTGTTVIQPPSADRPTSLSGFANNFVAPEPIPEIVSELPTEQTFQGGGVSFIGGTIRENPVDTLSEVINLFPELSASQAADFLNEFSGISPTDALRIDPDVSNIVANVDGVNVPVENIDVSDLDAAENRASCTTCELFGLNCERCQIAELSNA